MSLRFDEATHTYWQGDRRVPSVTQILGAMTDLDEIRAMRPGVIEHAADRGNAVHFGCELYDKGTLDWDSVSDELRPYVKAWTKFRRDTGFEPSLIEHKVFHPHLFFAGTLDRAGTIYGEEAIVDIKCVAAMYPTTGPQTAAYAEALRHSEPGHPKITKRYAVQLLPTGNYKLHEYKEAADWSVFVAMRTIVGWSEKHSQRILYEPA